MWRDFSKVLSELWHASGEPCSAYRADLHYMRGPGPKWHAKYDGLLTYSSPPTAPALHDTADSHA
jgi:hypothetical protein